MKLLGILIPIITLNSVSTKRHAVADFESISKDAFYIDKTPVLKEYLNLAKAYRSQLITSPPGFMKSTILDMIRRYVQVEVDAKGEVKPKDQTSNFQLFNNAKFAISNELLIRKAAMAEFPVIRLELSDVAAPTLVGIFIKLSAKIRKCYKDYEWLYSLYRERYSDDSPLENSSIPRSHMGFMGDIFQLDELPQTVLEISISKLVEILYWFFKREVIVLIDDYDAPVIDTVVNKDHITSVSLVQNIVDRTIDSIYKPETSEYLKLVLILGTNAVPLSLKNGGVVFKPFFINGYYYSPAFAITEDELSAKLEALNYDNQSIANIKAKFGGYKTKEHESIFCRPDSMARFFKNQSNDIVADSEIDGGSLSTYSMFINNSKIRTRVEELLNGSSFGFVVDRPVNILQYQKLGFIIRGLEDVNEFDQYVFFTILFENGYLTSDIPKNASPFTSFLNHKIPNEETLEEFRKFYSLYKAV